MSNTIDNTDDMIDSRDVIARIEELQAECDAYNDDADHEIPWGQQYPEAFAEISALMALQNQAEGYASDWQHGECLIRDSYFKDYAMQLADDIGAIPRDASWPNTCIDWEQAARELQMDYTAVDFDGVTYWVR